MLPSVTRGSLTTSITSGENTHRKHKTHRQHLPVLYFVPGDNGECLCRLHGILLLSMERSVPFLNACISFVAFVTALTLVLYMLIAFVTGVYDVAILMLDTVLLSPVERQSILNGLNAEFLHNIAILLILMKAYRILVEYMRYHHIDIKFMMEITIIACVLELLFNYEKYSEHMQLVLAAVAVSFVAIYAFRYEVFVKAMKDSQKEMLKLRK